jgi:cell division protein FtsI (penicillin-binding protein 3)
LSRSGSERPLDAARERRWLRIRVGVVLFFLGVWFVGITGRLAQLMALGDERVEEYSEKLHFGTMDVSLPRGAIYDRKLNEMAVSINVNSIYINPRLVSNPPMAVKAISKELEPEDVNARNAAYKRILSEIRKGRGRSFIWVRRKVDGETASRVAGLGLRGVGMVKESKRFYPKRGIASKIIGYCGMDNQGLYGIEQAYNKVMRPVSSRFAVLKDALGRPVSMPDDLSAGGKSGPVDLELTIDERIQYITEKALERQTVKSGAKNGVALVMDPNTGEILAMAEYPQFNPNQRFNFSALAVRPRAVEDAVEPGSTFKLFVAAAALEEKLISPGDILDCENGQYKTGGYEFKEALRHKYGKLTVGEVIAKSSNIGAIKIGEKLGPKKLCSRLMGFGFGRKTGIDLPGESSGLLRPASEWSPMSLPSISFGQEVSVTPMQLGAAVSAIANGGYLVRPHFVKAYMRNGATLKTVEPETVGRPISRVTAELVKEMMKGVTMEGGTGVKAAIPGFVVAGKTGTAQKMDPVTKTYALDRHLASFAGFFPADAPRLVIVVMIDEPRGVEWGGSVAGPVFSEIGVKAARVLRIPSSLTDVYEVNWGKLTGESSEPKARI